MVKSTGRRLVQGAIGAYVADKLFHNSGVTALGALGAYNVGGGKKRRPRGRASVAGGLTESDLEVAKRSLRRVSPRENRRMELRRVKGSLRHVTTRIVSPRTVSRRIRNSKYHQH